MEAFESALLPVLALKDMVVFPNAISPLFVVRASSLAAVEAALNGDKRLFLLCEKEDAPAGEPKPSHLQTVGTVGEVLQVLRVPDGSAKILVEGIYAARCIEFVGNEGFLQDIRILSGLNNEPWQSVRTGLMVIGMDPTTDLVRVSQLLENRTTYWEVAVCIPSVLSYYSVALLAQGAVKVMPHPMDDLEKTRRELKTLLKTLASLQSDALGLEVSDLIQLYGDKRVAKTIRLTGGGCVGSIYLHNGMVVHADTMDEEEGMTALQRLLAIRNPEIRVHKGALTDKKSIGIPAMSALLEGSRQMDEAERNSSVLDDPELMDIIPDDPRPATDSMDGIAMLTDHSGPSVKPGAKSLFSDEDLDLG